jgi:hypothetical protein
MFARGKRDRSIAGVPCRRTWACSFTTYAVAAEGWLIARDGYRVVWVDVGAYRQNAPAQVARIASLARALILTRGAGEPPLSPRDVSWLLAKPQRIACLVDFLMAVEDLAPVPSIPLRVTLTQRGEVQWSFVPARSCGTGEVRSWGQVILRGRRGRLGTARLPREGAGIRRSRGYRCSPGSVLGECRRSHSNPRMVRPIGEQYRLPA